MTLKINNRKDVLLLLLYSPGSSGHKNEPIVGRTRLVKMLFLFKKEALSDFKKGTDINESNFYEFFPWNFGPFSRDVYDDITFFTLRQFIESAPSSEEMMPEAAAELEKWSSASEGEASSVKEFDEESFSLTEKGLGFVEPMYELLSKQQRNILIEFKKHLNSAPLRAILRYVYTKYPDQTEKSQIRESILGY